jgi:hypothetical protein
LFFNGAKVKNLFKKGRYIFIATIVAAGVSAADRENDLNFTPATLLLRGIESDAEVMINDNLVEPPVSVPILTPAGYLHLVIGVKDTVYQKSFFIHPNERKTFNFKSDPRFAAIYLISEPLGASVSLEGKKMGVTPYHDSLIVPGPVNLTVDKNGYGTIRKELQLLPQEELELTLPMEHSAVWFDSVTMTKSSHRKKTLSVQRIIFGAISVTGGGIAAYFDWTAQSDIAAATASADAYDQATSGFQAYKDAYMMNRASARKNIGRRNLSGLITAAAASGLMVTFFF